MFKSLATPLFVGAFVGSLLLVQGCSPKVGSDAWCKQTEEKPKGEWSANDAAEYARSCILK